MKFILRAIKRHLTKYFLIFNEKIVSKKVIRNWKINGKPNPPPNFYKQYIVKKIASKYKINTLIESGTYFGDMVYACKDNFKRLISIELDMELFSRAKERFAEFKNISIYQGDSTDVLPEVLKEMNVTVLFWLDGHYSEGITSKGELNTPIIKELEAISQNNNKNHIILIDDARCFNGLNDYPTLEELRNHVNLIFNHIEMYVESDIIYIIPN